MIRNTRNIAVTSPTGCWNLYQLVGAKVRVSSLSVASGLFSFDSNSLYQIQDIKFRIAKDTGKAQASIYLIGIPGRVFGWKDIEIVSLGFGYSGYAVAGCFVAGEMWAGLNLPSEEDDPTDDLIPGDDPTDGNILD